MSQKAALLRAKAHPCVGVLAGLPVSQPVLHLPLGLQQHLCRDLLHCLAAALAASRSKLSRSRTQMCGVLCKRRHPGPDTRGAQRRPPAAAAVYRRTLEAMSFCILVVLQQAQRVSAQQCCPAVAADALLPRQASGWSTTSTSPREGLTSRPWIPPRPWPASAAQGCGSASARQASCPWAPAHTPHLLLVKRQLS